MILTGALRDALSTVDLILYYQIACFHFMYEFLGALALTWGVAEGVEMWNIPDNDRHYPLLISGCFRTSNSVISWGGNGEIDLCAFLRIFCDILT